MVSIKDVAKHAGVAISTVSKVLNNYPNVTETTKNKVNRAIKELNYVPNSIAAALSSKHSGRVALLMDPVRETRGADQIYMEYILGALDSARELGIDAITVFFSMLENMTVDDITRYLRSQGVQAIVVFGLSQETKVIRNLIQENKVKVRLVRDSSLITYILPRYIYVWLPHSWTLKPVSDWFPVDFYEGNQMASIPLDEIDMDGLYGHLKKANISYSQCEVEELINKMRSKNIEWKNILEKHSKIEAIKNKFLHLVEVGDTDTEDFKNRKLELKEALKDDFEELCNVACEIASELEERTPIDFVLELLEEADKIENSAEKKNTDFYRAEIYYKVGNIEKGDEYAEKVHSNLENEFDMDFLKDIRDETIKNRMK